MNIIYRHLHLFLLEKSVITKTKYMHMFIFDRFCSIALKILKYLLFPKIAY